MRIQIREGTVLSGIHLCDGCSYARKRRHSNGHIERQCAVGDEKTRWATVTQPVTECSEYHKGGSISFQAMNSIAWHYTKDDSGEITFKRASDEGVYAEPRTTFGKRLRRAIYFLFRG